ncbi:MAG: transcriptional regulator [Candidatus Altiarchaeales archaeon ex4484_2]|nr:MAG: transcriptional regulator [Candidatus Altiarchaeales archaeon ex4484_2]
MKIDRLDLEIIKHLQEDARLSFRHLGRKLNVPHTTVFTRAEKLVKNGVIKKFSALIHPHDMGLQTGFVIIDAPPAKSKDMAEKISKFNEARRVYRTFDGKIITKVVVSDQHRGLEKFLTKIGDYPMTTLAVHDVVKFEEGVHPEILKSLDIYQDK